MDNPFDKFRPQVDLAILKHAASASSDVRKDIRQEVMLAFVEASDTLLARDAEDEAAARGLAYIIARNAVIAYQKKGSEKVSRHSISVDDPVVRRVMEVVDNNAPNIKLRNPLLKQLVAAVTKAPPDIDIGRAVETLSEDEQAVVRGLFWDGMTQEELATELGQTRHWIREKKFSALLELKRIMKN